MLRIIHRTINSHLIKQADIERNHAAAGNVGAQTAFAHAPVSRRARAKRKVAITGGAGTTATGASAQASGLVAVGVS